MKENENPIFFLISGVAAVRERERERERELFV
jgi:hypothetical protein